MATDYKTPGVYIEEIPKFPPSVAAVETAIPAFIGYTETQKHLSAKEIADRTIRAVRITSLIEYEAYFGRAKAEETIKIAVTRKDNETPTIAVDLDTLSSFKMYYSLQFYFANGGGPCYIVSVDPYTTGTGTTANSDVVLATVFDSGPSKANKRNGLSDGLTASNIIDEVTLILFPDAQALSAVDYYALQNAALKSCFTLQDRFVIMDVYRADVTKGKDAGSNDITIDPIAVFRNTIDSTTNNLKYGAAYYPNVDTILDVVFDETKLDVTINGATPIKLDKVRDGDKTASPAINPDNALYNQLLAALRDKPLRMTPSSGIAGIYADTDSTRGVWKAPANVNMSFVVQPSKIVSNRDQEDLNVDALSGKSINVIRSFTGRGPALVWGARTLAGNDNEWRYISVRRFCNMVEESVKNACGQFVFEPNDANTWVRVRAMIENFLILQWRAGALQGAKPDQAFYVAVGLNQTMTALDVLEGRMVVEIGMAIVRPAEFIILRFSQLLPQS